MTARHNRPSDIELLGDNYVQCVQSHDEKPKDRLKGFYLCIMVPNQADGRVDITQHQEYFICRFTGGDNGQWVGGQKDWYIRAYYEQPLPTICCN